MFFKKSVKKATKKFRGLRSDLLQVISQEAKVQINLNKEARRLQAQQRASCNEQDEAKAILENVNQFLGKK